MAKPGRSAPESWAAEEEDQLDEHISFAIRSANEYARWSPGRHCQTEKRDRIRNSLGDITQSRPAQLGVVGAGKLEHRSTKSAESNRFVPG